MLLHKLRLVFIDSVNEFGTMKDFIDSSAVLPSDQVALKFVPQSIVRITLRKPKPVEELKAVSFMSSNCGGRLVVCLSWILV